MFLKASLEKTHALNELLIWFERICALRINMAMSKSMGLVQLRI